MGASAPTALAAPPAWRVHVTGAALACIAVAALAAWLSLAVLPGNVDVSWLLTAGGRLLDGARLHVDIVEVNPPFSTWLYLPFVVAERMTGVAAETWLALGLPAFALSCVALCGRIVAGTGALSGSLLPWLAPAALAVILLLAPGDTGQREQLATIAILPWLALLVARDHDRDFVAGTIVQRLLAGIGVAVFVMVKPPLAALAPALPALFLCVARRSARPLFTTETVVGAALTLAYLAFLAVFHLAFFTELLPMLGELYLPARLSLLDARLLRPVAILCLLGFTARAMAGPGGLDRAPLLLFLAAAGYVPAFLAMGKGWGYQALPFLMLGILGFLAQAWSRPPTRTAPLSATLALGAGALLMLNLADPGQLRPLAAQRAQLDALSGIVNGRVDHPTVMSIATRLQPAHPLTRMVGGTYLSRHPALWMVDNAEGLIATSHDAGTRMRLEALSRRFVAQAAADLVLHRPDIVVAGGTEPTPGQAAVLEDPAVARVLADYEAIYRDSAVTVFLRSAIAGSAGGS